MSLCSVALLCGLNLHPLIVPSSNFPPVSLCLSLSNLVRVTSHAGMDLASQQDGGVIFEYVYFLSARWVFRRQSCGDDGRRPPAGGLHQLHHQPGFPLALLQTCHAQAQLWLASCRYKTVHASATVTPFIQLCLVYSDGCRDGSGPTHVGFSGTYVIIYILKITSGHSSTYHSLKVKVHLKKSVNLNEFYVFFLRICTDFSRVLFSV